MMPGSDNEYKGTAIEDLLKQLPDHGEARVIVMKPGESYSLMLI